MDLDVVTIAPFIILRILTFPVKRIQNRRGALACCKLDGPPETLRNPVSPLLSPKLFALRAAQEAFPILLRRQADIQDGPALHIQPVAPRAPAAG
jgi:hypothetical protein